MSAAIAIPPPQEVDDVERSAVTHEQIIGALGRVEGLIEAEATARREFRDTFQRRLESVEEKTGEIAGDIHVIKHRLGEAKPQGAIASIAQLFERQPLLSVVFAGVILALGSGGIISIWEAVTR